MKPDAVTIDYAQSVADWAEIRRICCETGNGGAPISQERWSFFAEQWVGPYQGFSADHGQKWSYVIRNPDGQPSTVVGYLTGAPDTRSFERWRLLKHTPGLIAAAVASELLGIPYPRTQDLRRFMKRSLRLEKSPAQRFPSRILQETMSAYPAHLHMNLDASARGKRLGDLLVQAFAKDLRSAQIPGIHLFCGQGPVPFYLRNGFQELHRIEFRAGIPVHLLGLKL